LPQSGRRHREHVLLLTNDNAQSRGHAGAHVQAAAVEGDLERENHKAALLLATRGHLQHLALEQMIRIGLEADAHWLADLQFHDVYLGDA